MQQCLKNAPKLEVIPDSVDDEGLREAYLDADRHKWKKAELIAFDNASIAEQDEKGKISAAEKTLFTGQAQMAPYWIIVETEYWRKWTRAERASTGRYRIKK